MQHSVQYLCFQPNSERKPLDELNAVDEDMVDQPVDSKDHPIKGKISISSLAPDHEFHVCTLTLVVCKYYLFKVAVISTCTVMKLTN